MSLSFVSDRVLAVQAVQMPLPPAAAVDTVTVAGPAKLCVMGGTGLSLVVEVPDLYADPQQLILDRMGQAGQLVGRAPSAQRAPTPVDWGRAIDGLAARFPGGRLQRWRTHRSISLGSRFFVLAEKPDGDLAVSTVPIYCEPSLELVRWARRVHGLLRLVQIALAADRTLVYRVLLPAAPFSSAAPDAGTHAVASAIESLLTLAQVLPSPAMVVDRAFVRLLDLAAADSPSSPPR